MVRIVKFSERPQKKRRTTEIRTAERTLMHDKRRKARERKVVLVDGRLLRPCSRSFPLNSSASDSGERSAHGGAGEWSRRMTRESRRWERERDPCDEKGSTGESCEALRRMARLRGCYARGIKRKREKEGMEKERKRERKQPRR